MTQELSSGPDWLRYAEISFDKQHSFLRSTRPCPWDPRAQFSPFAALTGEASGEGNRQTDG